MTIEEFKNWFNKGNMHIICHTLQERESAAAFLKSIGYRDEHYSNGKLCVAERFLCPFIRTVMGSVEIGYRTLTSTLENYQEYSIEYSMLPIFADSVELQADECTKDMMSFLYAEVTTK